MKYWMSTMLSVFYMVKGQSLVEDLFEFTYAVGMSTSLSTKRMIDINFFFIYQFIPNQEYLLSIQKIV